MIRTAGTPEPVMLHAVCKSFGSRVAVDGVTFSVARGTCFGLLGPNGAGKSTALKMIYGFLRPSAGVVRVQGIDVARHPRDARRRLGVVTQEDALDPDLTVAENLVFHGRYCGLGGTEARRRAEEGLAKADLGDRGADKVSQLSAGLRRRIVLLRALLNDPSVLVLDEPTRGLDAAGRTEYLATVQRLKSAGAAVVLATHDLDEAGELCDAAALMQRGTLVRVGVASAVLGALAEYDGADEADVGRGAG